MVADHLHQVVTRRGHPQRAFSVRVHGGQLVTGLEEREERRLHLTPTVIDRVGADRVHERDPRQPVLEVDLHHRRHEAVREVRVSSGVHLHLEVAMLHVAVHDAGPLLRELPRRIRTGTVRVAVERRQWGHHLRQITGGNVNHVRDNAPVERTLREQVREHVPHAALTDRQHVLHARITLCRARLSALIQAANLLQAWCHVNLPCPRTPPG